MNIIDPQTVVDAVVADAGTDAYTLSALSLTHPPSDHPYPQLTHLSDWLSDSSTLFTFYAPRGYNWHWNKALILLHAPFDFITFLFYLLIVVTIVHIYRKGNLKHLKEAYPRLWLLGACFVLCCAAFRLTSFLEIWFGGIMYYITGLVKVVTAISAVSFLVRFWQDHDDIILTAQVMQSVKRHLHESNTAKGDGP